MAKQSSVSSFWQIITKWACLTLAFLMLAATLMLAACGGGYDGGKPFEEPVPTPEPAPVEIPAPSPEPTPEPIVRTESPRQMEYLDRGLVVIPAAKGNAVSWRLLGTDNPAIAFDVYRNGSKINVSPLTHKTFYSDEEGQTDDSYQVRGLVGSTEVSVSTTVEPWAAAYHAIDLNRPMDRRIGDDEFSYIANDASAADLDGDGQYEIILKWMPDNAKDNSQSGMTGNVLIDAYTLEGTHLWRIDLGHNIRAGAHYNPFMVYDFDGDGRAELAVKTADGTIDARGVVIGDPDADYRNNDGYILDGPEFLTMFDGLSGEALDTVDYTPARGVVGDWGDTYGNRVDRFMAGVAYLDGEKPSLFMTRGVYTRVVLAAYDWVDGAFSERWVFDTNNGGADAAMYGQGNHNLSVGDVDGDGKDEIIYGAGAIDDDGGILYATGLCDGDALHMGDFSPERAGLEVFTVHETPSCYANATEGYDHGVEMHDAATGEIIWSVSGEGADVGRGVSADIDPRYVGNESWASRGGLTAADGANVGSVKPGQTNFAIWWDGDLLRELLDNTTISKWNYVGAESYPQLNAANDSAVSNNGTKATPTLSADLFGDWREEVIWADSASTRLLVYSTPHSTDTRIHSLMHDPQYRLAIAWQNSGYNQPPHPGFYIGPDMAQHWESDIATTEGSEWAKLVAQGNDDTVDVRIYINGFDVSGIEIFRDTDEDPEGRVSIATLTGDERNYIDTGAVPDVTYYYWVELSGSTATTTIDMGYSRTSLTSTLLPSYWVDSYQSAGAVGPVKLSWTTTNIEISAINIYRVEGSSADEVPNFAGRTLVGSPDPSATEWTDDSSIKDTSYFYWVEFVDITAGETYTPNPRFGEHIPIPIIELTAEYVNNTIEVNWALDDFRPDISSVELYRNTVNQQGGRTRILPGAPASGTYTDNIPPNSATAAGPALPGITYWYTLKVVLTDGARPEIPLVPEEGITIPVDEALPMVGAWAVVLGVDPLEMQVSWVTYSVDVASIEIFRDTNIDGSTRISMGAADIATTSWVDTTPTPGTTYYYFVEVTDTDGAVHPSPVTNPVSLPPSTNLSTSLSGGGINISWDLQNFPVEITSVELYRNSLNQLGGRTRLSASVPTTGSFLDDGSVAPLVEGQTYWYMFKLNGGAINTNPEAEIAYP